MIRIVHLITGLGSGGAENMLCKFLKYSDKNVYYHEVISLIDEGIIGERIKSEGIKIHSLNLSCKNLVRTLLEARSICKNFDIINTWLYHADIFGFIVGKVLLNKKLIWNIRHSNLDKNANKSTILTIVKINCLISKRVDCITYNSNKALETHKKVGYSNKNSVVIPNGFELDKFKFNLDDRVRVRKELGLTKEDKVIITVGRWNIQKDYYTLLKALNELKKQNVDFKMMMIGTNIDSFNKEIDELMIKYNLKDNLFLMGTRMDVPNLLSAADVYVSSSLGESFSNAIGEAMACELPCVVTNVGDSKLMVGDTGKVVEAKDIVSMSKELFYYIKNPNPIRSEEARHRIIDNYEIKKIVRIFEENLKNLVANV